MAQIGRLVQPRTDGEVLFFFLFATSSSVIVVARVRVMTDGGRRKGAGLEAGAG